MAQHTHLIETSFGNYCVLLPSPKYMSEKQTSVHTSCLENHAHGRPSLLIWTSMLAGSLCRPPLRDFHDTNYACVSTLVGVLSPTTR